MADKLLNLYGLLLGAIFALVGLSALAAAVLYGSFVNLLFGVFAVIVAVALIKEGYARV